MIDQHDLDQLLVELEQARDLLQRDRVALRETLSTMLDRTTQLRRRAKGGPFEAAIVSVHELLCSFEAGVVAQDDLNSRDAA